MKPETGPENGERTKGHVCLSTQFFIGKQASGAGWCREICDRHEWVGG